jgi:hypothetical protein
MPAKGQMVDTVITEAPGAIGLVAPPVETAPPESTYQETHVRAISDSTVTDSIPMPCTPRTTQHPAVAPINVLVVDDDQQAAYVAPTEETLTYRLTRRLMAKMLTRLGHQVTTAKHGKEGLDVITDAYHLNSDCPAVDIVFLDK